MKSDFIEAELAQEVSSFPTFLRGPKLQGDKVVVVFFFNSTWDLFSKENRGEKCNSSMKCP